MPVELPTAGSNGVPVKPSAFAVNRNLLFDLENETIIRPSCLISAPNLSGESAVPRCPAAGCRSPEAESRFSPRLFHRFADHLRFCKCGIGSIHHFLTCQLAGQTRSPATSSERAARPLRCPRPLFQPQIRIENLRRCYIQAEGYHGCNSA